MIYFYIMLKSLLKTKGTKTINIICNINRAISTILEFVSPIFQSFAFINLLYYTPLYDNRKNIMYIL